MPLFHIAVVGNFVTMTDVETKVEVKGETKNLSWAAVGELMRVLGRVSFKKAAWTAEPVHLVQPRSELASWYEDVRWANESYRAAASERNIPVAQMEEW